MLPARFHPDLPIYRQLTEAFQRAIARGELKSGDRVPPVRELASRLVINPNTIQRAYQELERRGLFVTRRGLGTFVAQVQARAALIRTRLAHESVRKYFAEMRDLGYSREQAEAFVRALRPEKPAAPGGGEDAGDG